MAPLSPVPLYFSSLSLLRTALHYLNAWNRLLLSKQWFYTISGPFFQMKSANMHRWNIFLIEALSMLASPQIKTVKPPDKKPSISDKPSFFSRRSVRFQFVWQKLLQYSPGRVASKACWLTWFILRKMCLMVVSLKRTFYRNDGLSTTCQCRQLKLNPLSTQINIYCLMTNQTPALLVQRAPWTQATVMLLQSLYFSRPPPPTAVIPDARPPRYIWKSRGPRPSHEKIGDCEQSRDVITNVISANQHFAPSFSMQLFKFQRRICKLSFLFPPRRQSAPESLLAGYSPTDVVAQFLLKCTPSAKFEKRQRRVFVYIDNTSPQQRLKRRSGFQEQKISYTSRL